MNKPIIIIGNGGHALVLTELLMLNKKQILGFTSPSNETNKFDLAYLGNDSIIFNYDPEEIELVLGIGSVQPNSIRSKIFNEFKLKGYHFATCIHPKAIITSTAKIGEGVQIMAGAIIQSFAEIKDNSIVNTGAQIDHECIINKNVHLAPGTILSGNVQIGSNSHVGTGVKIIQGVTIGGNTMIAAGAVVVKDIPENSKVMGIPAKEV
ncbi:acetyltransferase [Rummeliibacillus sp. TYF005]|uniref:acetyltransferase n=1 Tax=Rummeliibacillus sp. TYF005 TaxID=2058214 RepID=UPI000F52F70F|nr:acetyltransferase [Rummeliibacillus sp. TYF005]